MAAAVLSVSVGPRVVRAPWEPAPEGRRTFVGREADVRPEEGPLALYQSAFPDRYVRWHRSKQLWEIRQRNALTGHDERVELLYWLDAPPDPATGLVRSDDEINAMIEARSPHLVRRYLPFDYEFVRDRLRQYAEFMADPGRYSDKVADRNKRLRARRRRATANYMAAGMHDIARHVPYLEAKQRGATESEAKTLVAPYHRVGIDLAAPPAATPPATSPATSPERPS